MNRRFALLSIVALAFAAAPVVSGVEGPARVSAERTMHPLGEVEIVVDGAPLHRYAHNGRWYVEATKGREYAIRLHNPYGVRVAVALSVDGLNTIDARETTAAAARKWVLNPYETVTISGWQTSRTEARRFEFTTDARSYGQALGKTSNLGVIAAVFFKERTITTYSAPRPDMGGRQRPAAPAPANEQQAAKSRDEDAEYAATGMGRRTDHAVTQVWLDLERTPANSVDIRYEFRPQLISLGILRPDREAEKLRVRERARGFEGFSPVPPGLR
jgi:hypothetical protein